MKTGCGVGRGGDVGIVEDVELLREFLEAGERELNLRRN